MTQVEFEAILADSTKHVDGDVVWKKPDDGHRDALAFRVDVLNSGDYPLIVNGWYNPLVPSFSVALIHRGVGRIYGLCIGHEHHNPSCSNVGAEVHKHAWSDATRDKYAYRPADISAQPDNPGLALQEFFREANIRHNGAIAPISPRQSTLF